MDKKEIALNVLREVNEVLSKTRGQFIEEIPKEEKTQPEKLLRRVEGIIKGFNEENAERKIKNLIKFMDGIKPRL